ncbi:hypothetical protein NQ318_018172 [Aromia moschata]|uniref:Reverse transcriptase domain-containing protein n=1 Tax=Aromia moschata TaxID=1265417 RepID=A0AAV8ZFM9_9CUCU|nr:hypothetical protein NQ318_018172 [Aromia moschata]
MILVKLHKGQKGKKSIPRYSNLCIYSYNAPVTMSQRGKYGTWSKENLGHALAAFLSGDYGLNKCCHEFGIPKATLKRHIENKNKRVNDEVKIMERSTVFSQEIESELVQHILTFEELMFGMTITDIRKLPYEIAGTVQYEMITSDLINFAYDVISLCYDVIHKYGAPYSKNEKKPHHSTKKINGGSYPQWRTFGFRGNASNYFFLMEHPYNGEYFQQHEGTAMGKSLSSFIANLFMSKFETEVKDKFEYFPRVWFRYVDDIFAVFDTTTISLDNFVAKLNNRFPTIKFTYEVEHNEQLPFLDVFVIGNSENKLEFDVYRIETATLRYIPNDSHHPFQHKMSSLNFLIRRLLNFPLSKERFEHEKQLVKNIAKNNVYNSKNKLQTLLGNPKDKIDNNEKSGIYEISCKDCDQNTHPHLNGQQVYTPNPNRKNKDSDTPMWKKRLEKKIDEYRADAAVLSEFLAGNNSRRVMAKTQAIARKAQIDLNNADHWQPIEPQRSSATKGESEGCQAT